MKKLIPFLFLFVFFILPVSASETEPSGAVLMVTEYSVAEGGLQAGKDAVLHITLQNKSASSAAAACKLTFSETDGDIRPVGTGTQYAASIAPGESFVWELPVRVSVNASDGAHTARVSVAFTQADGSAALAEDTLRLTVRQTAKLEIGNIQIPSSVVYGEQATLGFCALNTGKSTLYGVTLSATVDGVGAVGKTVLGTIAAGERAEGSVSFSTLHFIIKNRTGTLTLSGETETGEKVTATATYAFAVAAPTQGETQKQEDPGQPRLMVKSYSVEDGSLTPGEDKKLKIVLVNTHKSKAVRNIKLTFSESSGQIQCDGVASVYADTIGAGKTYEWVLTLQTAHTADSGEHTAHIGMAYEDAKGMSYSDSENIRLAVRQSVLLVWDNLSFPEQSVQGETVSFSLNLQNMGGAPVLNALLTFETDGLSGANSVLVGDIPSGESRTANANFNVPKEKTGDAHATVRIQWQDDYGDVHKEELSLQTQIVEKPEVPDEDTQKKQEQQQQGIRYWWLFLLGGLAVGVGGGAGTVFYIFNKKSRLQDEERL